MDHDPSHARPNAGPNAVPDAVPASDRLIADRLSTEARRIDLGPPMVDVVIHRGRQRQNRRRTAVGVMAVVGVCAGTIVGINVLSQPSDRSFGSVVGDGTSNGPPGTATDDTAADTRIGSPIHLVDSDLVWTTVEPDTAQALSVFSGWAGRKIVGDGPFLAWSTTPGVNTEPKTSMWRSDDGISWTQVADTVSMTQATIADRDGRFFAYGTAPSSAATDGRKFDAALSTSDDGGLTWNDVALPLDTADLADEPGVTGVSVSPVSIAAGPTGVLAAARVTVNVDWENLLPDGLWNTGNWGTTADGVEIYETQPCGAPPDTAAAVPTATVMCNPPATIVPGAGVSPTTIMQSTADSVLVSPDSVPINASTVPAGVETTMQPVAAGTLTWAELGISQKAAAYIRGVTQLFFSADGATFNAVAQPTALGDGSQNVQLTDVDDGFVASVVTYDDATNQGTGTLFHTVDGSSWAEMGPSPLTYAETFDSFEGRLVMSGQVQVGAFQQASMVAIRNSDGSWTNALLDDLSSPSDGVKTSFGNTSVAVGPMGITVVATQFVDAVAQAGGAEISRNGITMRAEDGNGEFSFIDESTSTTLASTSGRIPSTELVSLDPNTGNYDVRLEAGGDVIATFTSNEMFTRMEQIATAGPPPTTSVFHTTDGAAWSRESLTELAGQQLGSAGVRLTDTQVLVAATLRDQTAADGTPKQIILIGTPKA